MSLRIFIISLFVSFHVHRYSCHGGRLGKDSRSFVQSSNERRRVPLLAVRGGGAGTETSDAEEPNEEERVAQDEVGVGVPEEEYGSSAPKSRKLGKKSPSTDSAERKRGRRRRRRRRHASDVIQQLVRRSALDDGDIESSELRHLIAQRSQEYMQDLRDSSLSSAAAGENSNANSIRKNLPDPKRLLHFLAPKIPAIKHSPDIALRIQSVRSDMDPGVASCLVGSLGYACEAHDQTFSQLASSVEQQQDEDRDGDRAATHSKSPGSNRRLAVEHVSTHIIKERRFEQVVECILCGVDVKKRMKEYMKQQLDHDLNPENIEKVLDEEDARVDEGLSVRDCCRAAWGIAVLGAHQLGDLGGGPVMDLLIALSLRTRELLLARLQLLRQGDLFANYDNELTGQKSSDLTIEERMEELSDEIAQDAASAMWAFACARVCTGQRFAPLFEVCCSILCQNPVELRKRAQEAEAKLSTAEVGSNDAVERLARAEDETIKEVADKADVVSNGQGDDDRPAHRQQKQKEDSVQDSKDGLIDYLSPNEVTDVLWALALHGSMGHDSSRDEIALSETASAFREFAFARSIEWLKEELNGLLFQGAESAVEEAHEMNLGEAAAVEVVDAAKVICAEGSAMGDVAVENIAIEDSQMEGGVQHVQVIDAAAIMASSSVDGEDSAKVEQMFVKDLSSSKRATSEHSSNEIGAAPPRKSRLQIFTPHDLCSIAWAVTELHDSLQADITHFVTEIFVNLGSSGLRELSGSDLSNLAWAISRSLSPEENVIEPAVMVTTWIAESATSMEQGLFNKDGSFRSSLFQYFHPQELGRLVWAITRTLSFTGTSEDDPSRFILQQLALAALLTVAEDFAVFEVEDLVRALSHLNCLWRKSFRMANILFASFCGYRLALPGDFLSWEAWRLSASSLRYRKYSAGYCRQLKQRCLIGRAGIISRLTKRAPKNPTGFRRSSAERGIMSTWTWMTPQKSPTIYRCHRR